MQRLSLFAVALAAALSLAACGGASPSANMALAPGAGGQPSTPAPAPSAAPTPGPSSEALTVLDRVLAANGGSVALALEHTDAFWRVQLLDADGVAREYHTDAAGQILSSQVLPPAPHAAASFAHTPVPLLDALRAAGTDSVLDASLTVYRNLQVWRIAVDDVAAVHVDAKSGQVVE